MSIKARYEAIIFDYDGVIVDSMPLQEMAWRSAADEAKVPQSVEAALIQNLYAGHAGERMFHGINLPTPLKAQLRASKDRRWADEWNRAPLFPETAQVMRRLSRICRIGIATTAPRDHVEGVLNRAGIRDCIHSLSTDADACQRKPHPAMLLSLINGPLHAETDSSLMIGDTDTDREMASAAGVPFILFDPHVRQPQSTSQRVTSWLSLERAITDRVQ